MNKEITIYELLGLIKDNKEPKKIKYNYVVYEYKEIPEGTGYVNEYDNRKIWLANKIDIDDKEKLNSKIEIIDDNEDIEEIEHYPDILEWKNNDDIDRALIEQSSFNEDVFNKLNELSREVNKLRKENK